MIGGTFQLDAELARLRGAGWAVTRLDVVAHGLGGLTARLLAEERPAGRVDSPFSSTANAFRGRFRRAVTIGTPHFSGVPFLLRYFHALEKKFKALSPEAQGIATHIPDMLRRLPESASREDFLEQVLVLANRPEPSPEARFHLVATQVSTNSLAFRFLHFNQPADPGEPAITRLDQLAPGGSDGLVSIGEALNGFLGSGPGRTLIPRPNYLAHGGDRQVFDFARLQMEAADLGELATEKLDSPDDGDFVTADELAEGSVFTNGAEDAGEINTRIQEAVEEFTAGTIAKIEAAAGRQPRGGNPTSYELEMVAADGEPYARNAFWFAEVHGDGGVTRDGVAAIRNPSDHLEVTVNVDSGVRGDVVLFGSYLAQSGKAVFATPVLVTSRMPAGGATGLEVEPAEAEVAVGAEIAPAVFQTFATGERLRRWAEADDLAVVSSDPVAVDVSDPLRWQAVGEGMATVTLTFDGMSAQSEITVTEPFPALDRAAWLAQFFTPADIADPDVTGPAVDLDGDGLGTDLERLTGGDPRRPDPLHLPRAAFLEIGGEVRPVLASRVSTQLLPGEGPLWQRSADLAAWSELHDLAGPPDESDPAILYAEDFGSYYEILLDIGTLPAAGREYFRMASSAAP